MAEYRCRNRSSDKDRKAVEGLILDYACKNYMDNVIAAIVERRGDASFKDSDVPQLRIVASALYSVVKRDDITECDHALPLLDTIHKAAPDLVPAGPFVKLSTGIKTKVMLSKLLRAKFDYVEVFARLNRYFPKAELKTTGVSKEEYKLNKHQLRYRRLLTRLMLSASEREAYLANEMEPELGPTYAAATRQRLRCYVDQLNERLSTPVIEQIVSDGPHLEISDDIMDSQADCLDKLLAISFRRLPTEDQLLAILKECWEGCEETDTEDRMETSDGDEGDGWVSATDIFAFPESRNDPGKRPNVPSRPPDLQGRPSHALDTACSATHAGPCETGPTDEPVQDKPGFSDDVTSPSADGLVIDCPSKSPPHPVGARRKPQASESLEPTDKGGLNGNVTSRDAAPSSIAGVAESVSPPGPGALDQRQLTGSAPRELHLPNRRPCPESPGAGQSLPSVLSSASAPWSLEASDRKEIGGRSPKEPKTLPNGLQMPEVSGSSHVLPFAVHQTTGNTSNALGRKYFATGQIKPMSLQAPSPVGQSPQLSCQVSSPRLTPGPTLGRSFGAATVSKSRIYLSKSGPRSRTQWKRVNVETADSCVDPEEMEDHEARAHRNGTPLWIGGEPGESQVSTSSNSGGGSGSGESQGSSDSVSLLVGLCGMHSCVPKRPRVATSILQEDELTGLASSSLFEDTVISDIEVYPVTRLKHGVDIGSIRLPNTRSSELSTMHAQETSQCSETANVPALHLATQDNTVSSSSNSNNALSLDSNSAGQSQPAEVRVEEVEGHMEIPEMEERSCVDAGYSRLAEPSAGLGDESPGPCVQDVPEVSALKKVCLKNAVVNVKRLSHDSKVRRYLEGSTLSKVIVSSGDVIESADSEDSFVPDSDDEESAATSESSSLPCIELRPDPEHELVRRFPSLREYLSESSSEKEGGGAIGDHRMRECTVRLRRLKPMEIDALTQGKCQADDMV